MKHEQLVAELRRLFEQERRVQWEIGDLLVREFGPTPIDGHNDGSFNAVSELATELGQSLATLMSYRRIATTFAPSTRVEGASHTAHRAAAYAKDPVKVMHEAAQVAAKTNEPIRVSTVHHIASKPEHIKPERKARPLRNEFDEELISALGGSTRNLGRLLRLLRAMDAAGEELTPKYRRMVDETVEKCADYLAWIRSTLAGEDVADEAENFLRSMHD